MTRPTPARDGKYRLIFRHPCGALKTCATTDPIRYGTWCPRCTPDDGTDTFNFPPSPGWEQVFEGEGQGR